uniref:Uncharacterized protein n=1 Tax=Panagrolaimus sp. ES5 TaxID=591445 RepID=A0AC34F9G4_9BILA
MLYSKQKKDSRNQRAKKRSQKKEAEDEKKKAAEKKEADDENVRKDADKATQNEKETNEEACVPQKFAAEIGISREGVRPLLYYETPEKDYMVFREKNEGKAVCRSCYNLEKKSKNKNIVVIQRTFNMNIFEEDPLANHQFDCARITLKEKEDEQTANKLLVTRRKEKKEFKSQNDVAKLYPEQNKKLNLNEGQKKRLAYNLSRMVKQPEKISPRITRNRPQPLTGQKSSATLKAYGTPLGNKFPSDISLIAEPFDDVCEKLDNLDFGDNYETDVTEDTKITVIQSLGDGPSTFLRKLDEKIKQAKDS